MEKILQILINIFNTEIHPFLDWFDRSCFRPTLPWLATFSCWASGWIGPESLWRISETAPCWSRSTMTSWIERPRECHRVQAPSHDRCQRGIGEPVPHCQLKIQFQNLSKQKRFLNSPDYCFGTDKKFWVIGNWNFLEFFGIFSSFPNHLQICRKFRPCKRGLFRSLGHQKSKKAKL